MGKCRYSHFLPREGIKTVWIHKKTGLANLSYIDGVYAPASLDDFVKAAYVGESNPAFFNCDHISKGTQRSRKFRFFAYHDWKLMAAYTYTEILDNPDGYGKGDFYHERYIFPEYRKSFLVRFASADIIYFMFKSGLAKRFYSYLQLKTQGAEGKLLWDLIDIPANPCMPLILKNDGPEVQTYLFITKKMDTEKGRFGILETNGNLFNNMDLGAYHRAGEGHYNFDD